MKFFLILLLAKSIYILLTKASAKLPWHHPIFIVIVFFKMTNKNSIPWQALPESWGSSSNESKMHIVSSAQSVDTTGALPLRCAQWKHCSCGISIGNIALVVVFFFNGKTITGALLSAAGNAGWRLVTNGQGKEMLNSRITLKQTQMEARD